MNIIFGFLDEERCNNKVKEYLPSTIRDKNNITQILEIFNMGYEHIMFLKAVICFVLFALDQ